MNVQQVVEELLKITRCSPESKKQEGDFFGSRKRRKRNDSVAHNTARKIKHHNSSSPERKKQEFDLSGSGERNDSVTSPECESSEDVVATGTTATKKVDSDSDTEPKERQEIVELDNWADIDFSTEPQEEYSGGDDDLLPELPKKSIPAYDPYDPSSPMAEQMAKYHLAHKEYVSSPEEDNEADINNITKDLFNSMPDSYEERQEIVEFDNWADIYFSTKPQEEYSDINNITKDLFNSMPDSYEEYEYVSSTEPEEDNEGEIISSKRYI